MSSLRVNKQRRRRERSDSFGEAMSFHVAPLNPVSGTRKFPRSYVRSSRRSSAAGLAVQTGSPDYNLVGTCRRSLLVPSATVRFEPNNRCPPSLKPPAFKLCARTPPRVNISIKQRPGRNSSSELHDVWLGRVTFATRRPFVPPESHYPGSARPSRSAHYYMGKQLIPNIFNGGNAGLMRWTEVMRAQLRR